MSFIKFTDFNTKTPLSTGDFLVGFADDSTSKEYKSTIKNIWDVYTNYQSLSYNENNQNLIISNGNSVSLSSLESKDWFSVYTNVYGNSSLWDGILPIKTITSSTYYLQFSDISKLLIVNSNQFTQIIIPFENNIPNGSKLQVLRYGLGGVQILADTGNNIRSAENLSYLTSQYSVATLVKLFPNEWELYGDVNSIPDIPPTPTPTMTPTVTPGQSPTPTETPTCTPSFTVTKTITPTVTQTNTSTPTPTQTPPDNTNGVIVMGSGSPESNGRYEFIDAENYLSLDYSGICYISFNNVTQAWWMWNLDLEANDPVYVTEQFTPISKPWFGTWAYGSQDPHPPLPVVLEDLPPINVSSTQYVRITNASRLNGIYDWSDRILSTNYYVRSDNAYLIADPDTTGFGYWSILSVNDLSTPYAQRTDSTDASLLPRNAWSLTSGLVPLSGLLISIHNP